MLSPYGGGGAMEAKDSPGTVLVSNNITSDPKNGWMYEVDEKQFVRRFRSGRPTVKGTHMPWAGTSACPMSISLPCTSSSRSCRRSTMIRARWCRRLSCRAAPGCNEINLVPKEGRVAEGAARECLCWLFQPSAELLTSRAVGQVNLGVRRRVPGGLRPLSAGQRLVWCLGPKSSEAGQPPEAESQGGTH